MGNFKNSYKILLYHLIVGLLSVALALALVYPGLRHVINSEELSQFFQDIKDFLHAIVTGNTAYLEGFNESFLGDGGTVRSLLRLLRLQLGNIILSTIGMAVIYLVQRILNTVCYFTIGGILDNRMATYSEGHFFDEYVRNFGKAIVYSIVYVPIVFLFDLLVIVLCYFLFFYLFSFFSLLLCLFLSITFIVFTQAFKLTLTCMWLPAMVADGQTIGKAMSMKDKGTKGQRRSIFLTYVTTVYLVIIINVVTALTTVGSGLLVSVPASYFFFICQQFVNYYTVKGKKYFITYESVVVNPSKGQKDGFFAAMENATLEQAETSQNPTRVE